MTAIPIRSNRCSKPQPTQGADLLPCLFRHLRLGLAVAPELLRRLVLEKSGRGYYLLNNTVYQPVGKPRPRHVYALLDSNLWVAAISGG